MAYTRKTRDIYDIYGFYYGTWECVTTEETRKEARDQVKTYRENERGTAFKVVKKREKVTP